jgi:3-oxoacyl-[acyl-carrier-protein] synthase II
MPGYAEEAASKKNALGVILGGGAPDFTKSSTGFFQISWAVSAYNIPARLGTISSEISLHFDLRGPSHMISTGCTSSTDAIGYAFNMIRFGQADHLITGGVDATITRGIMQGFCVMHVVSTTGNENPRRASRPFDRLRDGFVLGEGAWILVLEERERALARGARVFAEVLDYGSTCDAYHRVRLDPRGEEPARAMSVALEDAGVAKDEVGYLALHGTATELNDKTESLAVSLIGKLTIPTSRQTMIGHPEPRAPVIAAISG